MDIEELKKQMEYMETSGAYDRLMSSGETWVTNKDGELKPFAKYYLYFSIVTVLGISIWVLFNLPQ